MTQLNFTHNNRKLQGLMWHGFRYCFSMIHQKLKFLSNPPIFFSLLLLSACGSGRMPVTDSSSLSGQSAAQSGAPGSSTSLSYEVDIKPILLANCVSCHGAGKLNPNDWQNYDNVIAKKDAMYQRIVVLKNMPLVGNLPQADRDLIGAWINAGAPRYPVAASTPPSGTTTPDGTTPTPPTPPITPPSPPTPAQQAQLTDKLHYCAWCHGSTGAEAYSLAPRLAGQQASYITSQLTDFMAHKRDGINADLMWGATGSLDPKLIPLLADFYSKQVLSRSDGTNSTLANRGKEIFTNGIPTHNVIACAACHGFDAKGNDSIPRLANQDKSYIIRQLEGWRSGYRASTLAMPDEVKGMTDDDIKAVAEYVNFLQ